MCEEERYGGGLEALELTTRVMKFLEDEAQMLDESDFEQWESLWEPDGAYWVPQDLKQRDFESRVSLVYDDRAAIARRVERLAGRQAYALQPPSEASRLIGNVRVVSSSEGVILARSRFMMIVYRRERFVPYGGRMEHHLRERGDGFGIVLKRVDLVGAGASFANFTVVF